MNHISSICGFEGEPRYHSLLAIVFALAGALIAGCVSITPETSDLPQLISCAKFGFSHWREFDLGLEPSPDGLLADVSRLYEIERAQIHIETDSEGETQKIHWTDNNARYVANFRGGGYLAEIEVHWDREMPTLAQVTDCLGPPRVRDYTYEEKTHRVWADGEFGESPYPGNVTLLLVEGISTLGSESVLQEIQPVQRVNRLVISATRFPQQIIESPNPFPCAKFSVSHWQEFRFGVDSLDDVVATVIRLWGIEEDQIDVGETADGNSHVIEWNDAAEESYYDAGVVKGAQLDRFHVQFLPVPTLSQVLDCLGTPDYYIANGGPRAEGTHLQIWYVEQGFIATGHVFHSGFAALWQEPLKAIPFGFGMSSFRILPAGIDQMARRFNYRNPVLCDLRLWPGSIEAIEIEEDFYAPCTDSDAE